MSKSKESKESKKRSRTSWDADDQNGNDDDDDSSDTDTAKWSDDDFDSASDDEKTKTKKREKQKKKSKSKSKSKDMNLVSKRRDESKIHNTKKQTSKKVDDIKTVTRPKKRAKPSQTKDVESNSASSLEMDDEQNVQNTEETKALRAVLASSAAEFSKTAFRGELATFITNSTILGSSGSSGNSGIGASDVAKIKIDEDLDAIVNNGMRISIIMAMRMAKDEEKQVCLELLATSSVSTLAEQKTNDASKEKDSKLDCIFLSLGTDMAVKYILYNGTWTCIAFLEALAQKQTSSPPIYPGTTVQLLRLMRRNQMGYGTVKSCKTTCQRTWIMLLHRMISQLVEFYIKNKAAGGICTCSGEHDEIENALHVTLGA